MILTPRVPLKSPKSMRSSFVRLLFHSYCAILQYNDNILFNYYCIRPGRWGARKILWFWLFNLGGTLQGQLKDGDSAVSHLRFFIAIKKRWRPWSVLVPQRLPNRSEYMQAIYCLTYRYNNNRRMAESDLTAEWVHLAGHEHIQCSLSDL